METFSALLAICAGNSPVPGEFPTQRPVTRSFDVFFDLRRNKQLSKQSWGWWFETLSGSLWRHCNVLWKVAVTVVKSCAPPIYFVRKIQVQLVGCLWNFPTIVTFHEPLNACCLPVTATAISHFWRTMCTSLLTHICVTRPQCVNIQQLCNA